MEEKNKSSCRNCEYYTDSFGESGYCKLYRHDVTQHDIICSRYVHGEESTNGHNSTPIIVKRPKKMLTLGRSLYICGIVSCVVLLIIGIIFGSIMEGAAFDYENVPIYKKVLVEASIGILILLAVYGIFTLVRKYNVARIIVSLLTVGLVIFILLNYNTIWYSFQDDIEWIYEQILHFS